MASGISNAATRCVHGTKLVLRIEMLRKMAHGFFSNTRRSVCAVQPAARPAILGVAFNVEWWCSGSRSVTAARGHAGALGACAAPYSMPRRVRLRNTGADCAARLVVRDAKRVSVTNRSAHCSDCQQSTDVLRKKMRRPDRVPNSAACTPARVQSGATRFAAPLARRTRAPRGAGRRAAPCLNGELLIHVWWC